MLVYIHPHCGVWLNDDELEFVRFIKEQGQYPMADLTFDQLALFNKLQAKAILKRRKHEDKNFVQMRHSLAHLLF